MKVFISQPMLGKTRKEIVATRKPIEEMIKLSGDTIIESLIIDDYPESKNKRVWYLSKAIEIMSGADAIYFVNGWENSNGCCIEHEIAVRYNMLILSD